jgi:glycosyltransferase involved in cell wall biosynthesis
LNARVILGTARTTVGSDATGVVVGIDASRNRSGGAKAHLVGILKESDPRAHGIQQVHVWSYKSLLDALPEVPCLIKHNPPELEGSLLRQAWWQYHSLPKAARALGCDVLLSTDAGSVCGYQPAVVMSRDMLSYEPGEMRRYGVTKARARLILLFWIQNRSLRAANGVIFLTKYAAEVIQRATGRLPQVAVIPHGVGNVFRRTTPRPPWPTGKERPIRCLYVSNAAMYKHQWHVVAAMALLRKRGHQLQLTLAGGGSGRAQQLLDEAIRRHDSEQLFVKCIGFVPPDSLPSVLHDADLFIFASSCENMPNTLVEAMAAGLPIACSDRGPMPEVIADAGVLFDPEDPDSIASAVERLIFEPQLRSRCAVRAEELAQRYSWSRCGAETWGFLRKTVGR